MKNYFNYTVTVVLFVVFLAFVQSCNDKSLSKQVLFDPIKYDAELISANDATFEFIEYEGSTVLKVVSGFDIKEPGVKIVDSKANPWNLDGYYQVQAEVQNIGDEEMQVELFVGNDPDGLVRWFCSDYVDLKPGESKTITVPLVWTAWVHEPQLDIVGMRGVPGKKKMDLSTIHELNFNARYSTTKTEFIIKNVQAVNLLEVKDTSGFFPFVDEYGQYKHQDWETKIYTNEDLKTQNNKEQLELELYAEPKDRSKFGGWTAGPKLEATGYFYPYRYKDKWWLVDPEGYLFLSVGLNCVNLGGSTGIDGREHYFETLPEKDSITKQFYHKSSWASHGFYKDKTPYEVFNFYVSNLYKKFGEDLYQQFKDRAHARVKSWGMNTIGFVSDRGLIAEQKTPYVGSVWINGTPKIEGSGGYWGKFHDVFDLSFKEIVRKSVERQKQGANDPWCIGYFVDNEMSWGKEGSLALAALKSPANQPAKIEFVTDLRKKYKSINALNNKWGSNYTNWNDMLQNVEEPDIEKAKDDLLAFYEKIAQTYFKIIHDELARVAPNQNYLGCRFAWKNNDITIKSAAKYCDIISFNKYEYSVENVGLPAGVNKPILIGEFHFGSTDRGLTHPGVKVAQNQADRGQKYQDYMQGAFGNPNIIGAHWFQYRDQPLTGRGDGENYNVGFIDMCDTPFGELIEKVRETTYGMYEYRLEY